MLCYQMSQLNLDPGKGNHDDAVVEVISIISRSLIKLTGSRGNILYEGVYGGDILLRLTHSTEQRTPPEVDTNVTTEQGKATNMSHVMLFCSSSS